MTSTKQLAATSENQPNKTTVSDSVSISAHSQSVSSKNMDNVAKLSEESDRNSSSPSKTADPARKKTFKIISMKKGGSGDVAVDNDADSMDGLDESQTEDLSSEFYDSSKATDIDQELQDNLIPLTPDDVTTSTTTVVIKQQKPDRDSQSRFKVVKIETKEPFRRGKWICYDFLDSAPTVAEKIVTKVPDDNHLHSDMSSSTNNSVQIVQNMKDSSTNIIVPLSSDVEGKTPLKDMFAPIEPAPSSLIINHIDNSSKDNIAQFTPQQPILDATGVLTSSLSHQNIIHQQSLGQNTLVQSLPQTNIFPYTQNAPGLLYQVGQTGQSVKTNIDSSTVNATGSQAVINQSLPAGDTSYSTPHDNSSLVSQNSGFLQPGVVPRSQSQGQINQGGGVSQAQQIVQTGVVDSSQNMASAGGSIATSVVQPGGVAPSSIQSVVNNSTMQDSIAASANSGVAAGGEASALIGVAMDESTGSTKTIQGDMTSQLPSAGFEDVMAIDLDTNPEEEMDENGTSTVAIDNKIEQAMDLVKRHLMYAVREEVEILKQQIGELMDRIGQLEYENTFLKSEAQPETLNKLLTAQRAQPKTSQQPTQQINAAAGTSAAGQVQGQGQQQQQQSATQQPNPNAVPSNAAGQAGQQPQTNLNQQIPTNQQQNQVSNQQQQPQQSSQQQQSESAKDAQNGNHLSQPQQQQQQQQQQQHNQTTTTTTTTPPTPTTTPTTPPQQQQQQQQQSQLSAS